MVRITATLAASLAAFFLSASLLQAQTNQSQTGTSSVASIEELSTQLNYEQGMAGNAADLNDIDNEMQGDVAGRNFQPAPLLLPNKHFFGDWLGWCTEMESNGITPTITWVSNILGNPVGGRQQGFTECENLGMDFVFDLEKRRGIEDTTFHVSMSQRSGQSLSNEYIGNAFSTQQVYGGETFKVIDVDLKHKFFDDHLTWRIGRIAAGDDFLVSPYFWLFMQNGIDGNPVGIFKNSPGMTAYPNASWGTRLKFKPSDHWYFMGGVYDGNPDIRDNSSHGMDWSMHGPLFAIAEASYQPNGLTGEEGKIGHYKFGSWYNAGTFTDAVGTILGTNASRFGLTPQTTDGNWGYYALFDQVICKIGGEDTVRGIGVFGSVLVSPDTHYNQMPFFCNGGVAFRGLFEARPTDTIGVAVVYGRFSEAYRGAQTLAHTLDASVLPQGEEMVFEWLYRFRLKDGAAFFQPDLQYIVNPNGTGAYENAFAVGAQMGLNF